MFSAARSQSMQLKGDVNSNRIDLNWSIDSNEAIDKFEVERSFDGTNFKIAALVFTSEKTGKEDYKFYERMKPAEKIYYRIKRFYNCQEINYSNIICLSIKDEQKIVMNK
jgi:hypothetical protein